MLPAAQMTLGLYIIIGFKKKTNQPPKGCVRNPGLVSLRIVDMPGTHHVNKVNPWGLQNGKPGEKMMFKSVE